MDQSPQEQVAGRSGRGTGHHPTAGQGEGLPPHILAALARASEQVQGQAGGVVQGQRVPPSYSGQIQGLPSPSQGQPHYLPQSQPPQGLPSPSRGPRYHTQSQSSQGKPQYLPHSQSPYAPRFPPPQNTLPLDPLRRNQQLNDTQTTQNLAFRPMQQPRVPQDQQYGPHFQGLFNRAQNNPNAMQAAPNAHVAQQNRSGFDGAGSRRPVPQNRHLFNPGPPGGGHPGQPTQLNHPHQQSQRQHQFPTPAFIDRQKNYFNWLAPIVTRDVSITVNELKEKEHFRLALEKTAQGVIADFAKSTIDLVIPQKGIRLNCYGSLANGFAVKDSDMDLLLVIPNETAKRLHDIMPGLQRALEKAVLDSGLGARLLTKTRVPILRVCEKPTAELYAALKGEREKWEREGDEPKKVSKIIAPDNQRIERPARAQVDGTGHSAHEGSEAGTPQKSKGKRRKWNKLELKDDPNKEGDWSKPEKKATPSIEVSKSSEIKTELKATRDAIADKEASSIPDWSTTGADAATISGEQNLTPVATEGTEESVNAEPPKAKIEDQKSPVEEKVPRPSEDVSASRNDPAPPKSPAEVTNGPHERRDTSHLEFPKLGIGIQCDVNFSNHIALHNTQLLRCYTICDDRVRDMGLFVKAWAKCRKINSPYHGTLSSYGYVLMVLHYLVNIADPPVLPNLQLAYQDPPPHLAKDELMNFDGCDVRFLRDEKQLDHDRRHGRMTRNNRSLGTLLCGFFEYYSTQGPRHSPKFQWTNEVISLRTSGGIVPKSVKGWTGAKSTESGVKLRFLMAIEDPFEIDHNVARTVVHGGIVAIRDEFRRAYKILTRIEDVPGCGWQWRDDDGSIGEDLFKETEDRLDLQKPRFKDAQESKDGPKLEIRAGAAATQVPGPTNTQGNRSGSVQAKTSTALSEVQQGKLPISSNGRQPGEGSKRGQQQKGDANLGTRKQQPNPPPNHKVIKSAQKIQPTEVVPVQEEGKMVTQPSKKQDRLQLKCPNGDRGLDKPAKLDDTNSKAELSKDELRRKERNKRQRERRKAKAAALYTEKRAGKLPATSAKENLNPVVNAESGAASNARPTVDAAASPLFECNGVDPKNNSSSEVTASSKIPAKVGRWQKKPKKKALENSIRMAEAGQSNLNPSAIPKAETSGPSKGKGAGGASLAANIGYQKSSNPSRRPYQQTKTILNKDIEQTAYKNDNAQATISTPDSSKPKANGPSASVPSTSKSEKLVKPRWWEEKNRHKNEQRAAKRATVGAKHKISTSHVVASPVGQAKSLLTASTSLHTSESNSAATLNSSITDISRSSPSNVNHPSVPRAPGNFSPETEPPVATSFESDCLFPNAKKTSLFNRDNNEVATAQDVSQKSVSIATTSSSTEAGKPVEMTDQVLEGLGEVAGYDSDLEEQEVGDDSSDDETTTDDEDDGSGSEECPSEC